jgi:glycosyltransferase involved in cell wall biosynthesis
MKNLVKKYNHQDAVLMVSLYPKKGELYSSGTSGVASYAKNIVTRMQSPVIVLADRDKRPYLYEEDNVLVNRCFTKAKLSLWLRVLKQVVRFNKVSRVVIQFDFGMYGSLLSSALVIPFLFVLKLLGKQSYIVSHHVITDVFKLKGHVGLGNSWLDTIIGKTYNFLFKTFYWLLSLLSEKIVVLEEPLKAMLAEFVPQHKISVVAHGVDTKLKPMNKVKARQQLNLKRNSFLIMYFGFVNWFKGADIFAQTFQNRKQLLHKNVSAVIAGGESPTMKSKHFYQKYFTQVTKTVSDSPVVNMTGYIPQEEIKKYFSAADLIVFPYRHFMTASGVMSLALSYGKPFIVSCELSQMFDSPEFQKTLKQVGLKKTDIVFNLSKYSCLHTAENVLRNGIKRKMAKLALIEREKRDYAITARAYETLFAVKPRYVFTKNLSLFKAN